MQNILFILTSFRHGGTNKSLENLLSLIDTKQYQVDVFAMEHHGPYKEMLPNCTILPEDKWLSALIAHYGDTKGIARIRSFMVKLLRVIGTKLNLNITDILNKKVASRLVKNKKYDAIIAFSEGVPTAFVAKIQHPNTIAWVHCDYSNYMKLNHNPDERTIYQSYKSIVCVSEYTKGEFLNIFPSMSNKVFAMHNLVNVDEIIRLAKEKITDARFVNDKFTILSVGRIDVVKQFDKIPAIVADLKESGVDLKWYLIGPSGFGKAQSDFEFNIKKHQVEDSFVWLGAKENPYSYMKNSDLLVMTSRSEACPYVLNEAKILSLPVLTTNYGSATEFIENGTDGFIAPVEELTQKIELLVNNKELYGSIRENLNKNEYNNHIILKQFYTLIV